MRAVARMLDLAEIFQRANDGFNQGPSLEQCVVEWRVLDRLDVLEVSCQ
jgi:hypothetical protein